jgi:hypothetical protein
MPGVAKGFKELQFRKFQTEAQRKTKHSTLLLVLHKALAEHASYSNGLEKDPDEWKDGTGPNRRCPLV